MFLFNKLFHQVGKLHGGIRDGALTPSLCMSPYNKEYRHHFAGGIGGVASASGVANVSCS